MSGELAVTLDLQDRFGGGCVNGVVEQPPRVTSANPDRRASL